MNQAAFFILLLIVVFLITSGGPGYPEPILDEYKDYLRSETNLLSESLYAQGYGNLTGFKLSYQDNLEGKNASFWPFRSYTPEHPWRERQEDSLLPNEISDHIKKSWGTDRANENEDAYLFNITGEAFGEFDVVTPDTPLQRFNLELPSSLNEYFNKYKQDRYEEEWRKYHEDPENNTPPADINEPSEKVGNITRFKNGDLSLEIYKIEDVSSKSVFDQHGYDIYEDATLVFLNLKLNDKNSAESHEFGLFAVYFHETGSMVGLSKTAKFRGTIALPHFTFNEENHNKTKVLMERLLNSSRSVDEINIDDVTNAVNKAESSCELVTFFQFKKTGLPSHRLRLIDDELKHPLGMPLENEVPQLEIASALMYSPDCGLVFQKTPNVPLVGDLSAIKFYKIRKALIALLGLILLENKIFMRQIKFGSTPTQLSNISSMTIELISDYDLIVLFLMLSVIWVSDLYLLSASIAIFKGILFYVLETPYRSSIEATQVNERGTTWWQILRASGRESSRESRQDLAEPSNDDLEAQNVTADNSDIGANNETAPTNQEFIVSNDQSRNFFIFVYVTFIFVALLIMQSMSWNTVLYRVVKNIFLVILHSFWVPQFLRSTLKNRPNALTWEFVCGMSILKLIPVAYFFLKKTNPFKKTHDPLSFYLVASWIGLQLLLLFLQSKFGARFWISNRFLPKQYNYHPIIHAKAIPGGFIEEDSPSSKAHTSSEISIYHGDCVICMETIHLPVVMDDSDDKKYAHLMDDTMVTPCHHLFHTPCLENWMKYKLQCPVCRSAIPPV